MSISKSNIYMQINNYIKNKIGNIQSLHKFNIYARFAFYYIDHIMASLFLFGGIVIIYLSYFKGIGQYGMGIAFIIAICGYYIIKYMGNKNNIFCTYPVNVISQNIKQKLLISDIFFYIIFAATILYVHSFLYYRNLAYFILISIAFTILVIQSLYIKFSVHEVFYFLFKLSLISVSFRASRFFAFPTIIGGGDASEHLLLAKSIQVLGYIQPYEIIGNKYSYTPLWHILEAIIMLFVNNGYAISFFIFISVVIITITFLVYTIGKLLFNFRVGLIAALFANIGDMIFVKTVTSVDTSLIVMVYILIILLCFYYSQKTFFALSVLLMFCMFFTHQISVFASFIIIIGFFLGILFGRKLIIFLSKNTIIKVSHERVSHIFVYPNVIYTILWGVWFIVYFSITKYGNSDVFSTMIKAVSTRIKTMIQIFQSNEELVGTPYEALFQQYNFMDLILYNLGQNLLLCLAILGILLFLIYCINQYGISLIIAILSLFIVIYVGTFLGLGWILFPHRLLPFLQLLYIIFSAFGLYALYCSIPDKSKYLLVLITLLMVFFLITTPYINRDDTLYCEANEVRVQLTLSELTGIECGQKISPDKHIIVDQWVKTQYFSTIENTDIDRDKLSIYPDKEGLIYIRDYVVEKKIFPRPGRFGTSGFIDYSNYLMDIINKDVKIYDNKNVWIYKSN